MNREGGGGADPSGNPAQPTVAAIMRQTPQTTTPGELLAAAQGVMERENIRQLPVVEKGKLVGMLSERDLHQHAGYLERTKVDAAMTWNPLTIAPTTSARDAARLLIEKKINALPVVDGDRLLGIISKTDLLRLLVDLLGQRQA
jgi:CBS domain-containing protein